MKRTILLLLLLKYSISVFAQCQIDYSKFNLVFEDDFTTYANIDETYLNGWDWKFSMGTV